MFTRLEFHPTGLGYVLCRRFYEHGAEGNSLCYELGCRRPGLLTNEQVAEFDLAMEMEQEAANGQRHI